MDPYTRAFGSTSPGKAPTESLLGWTEQMQQSEEQLMEKVRVMPGRLCLRQQYGQVSMLLIP